MSKELEALDKLKLFIMNKGDVIFLPSDYDVLLKALKRLQAIESVDGGEVMKILQKLATIPLNIDAYRGIWTTLSTQDDYKKLENFILKSQQQAKELEELKEFILDLEKDNDFNDWLYHNNYAAWVYINNLKKLVGRFYEGKEKE